VRKKPPEDEEEEEGEKGLNKMHKGRR